MPGNNHANGPSLSGLPETGAIQSLLGDLMGGFDSPPAPKAVAAVPASASVAQFFAAINWRNEVQAAPSSEGADAVPVGGQTVSVFFAGINWRNQPRAASREGNVVSPLTFETVMSEFNWD